MERFKNKFRIPSARLQHWDYSNNAAYFVTICTQGREDYFGNVVDGKMNLSDIGIIADILWYEMKKHVKYIKLGEFVIMPNHVHGIIIIDKPDNTGDDDGSHNGSDNALIVETLHATSLQQQQQQSPQSTPSPNKFMANISPKSNSLSTIIRSYKSAVSKHAHRLGFDFAWQPRFHDHIIRNDKAYHQISEYIVNNPLKWQDDSLNPNIGL